MSFDRSNEESLALFINYFGNALISIFFFSCIASLVEKLLQCKDWVWQMGDLRGAYSHNYASLPKYTFYGHKKRLEFKNIKNITVNSGKFGFIQVHSGEFR